MLLMSSNLARRLEILLWRLIHGNVVATAITTTNHLKMLK